MQCNLWWRDQCAECDSYIQSKICVEKIKVKAATAVSFSLKKFNMSDNFFFSILKLGYLPSGVKQQSAVVETSAAFSR